VTTRRRNLLVLAALAALALASLLLSPSQSFDSPLDAVPPSAFLIVTVDVRPLAASPLGPRLLDLANDAANVRSVSQRCGFEPLEQVRHIVVAVPEGHETSEFAVIALGPIDKTAFLSCAQRLLEERGLKANIRTRGAFTLVDEARDNMAPGPVLALRQGGPAVVGRGPWLEEILATLEGKKPRLDPTSPHRKLREGLEGAVVATAILPEPLRSKLRKQMGAELGAPGANGPMAGVLGVSQAALAVNVGPSVTSLALSLRCDSPAACGEVEKLLYRQRFVLSQNIALRLLGLGPLIDSFSATTKDTSLSARTHVPTDKLVDALGEVLSESRSLSDAGGSPLPPHDRPTRNRAPSIDKGASEH
jgi:hypothetical protein